MAEVCCKQSFNPKPQNTSQKHNFCHSFCKPQTIHCVQLQWALVHCPIVTTAAPKSLHRHSQAPIVCSQGNASVVVVFMEWCQQDDDSGESNVETKTKDTNTSECLKSLFTSLFDFFVFFSLSQLRSVFSGVTDRFTPLFLCLSQ